MRHAYSILVLALGAFTTLSGHLLSDMWSTSAPAGDTLHLIIGFFISLIGALMMVASLIIRQQGRWTTSGELRLPHNFERQHNGYTFILSFSNDYRRVYSPLFLWATVCWPCCTYGACARCLWIVLNNLPSFLASGMAFTQRASGSLHKI